MTEPLDSTFETHRGRLFGIGYRMLGSRAEAEDLVQEAYVRWHQTDQSHVQNPQAWLVTTATRLAIDRLRALKVERAAYVGPWLPEPVVRDAPPPPEQHVELAADLSMALMVLLERLAPEERAAFLLHDVFDFDHREIALVLEKSEGACRQIVHRARTRIRSERKRFDVDEAAKAKLLDELRQAMGTGDQARLLALFAPNATWVADGGGRAAASRRPIVGAETIAKLLTGLHKRLLSLGELRMELVEVNGETGLRVMIDERLQAVISIVSDGERIHAAYAVVNPEKLPVASA